MAEIQDAVYTLVTSAGFEHLLHAVKETTDNPLEAIQEMTRQVRSSMTPTTIDHHQPDQHKNIQKEMIETTSAPVESVVEELLEDIVSRVENELMQSGSDMIEGTNVSVIEPMESGNQTSESRTDEPMNQWLSPSKYHLIRNQHQERGHSQRQH